MELGSQIRYPGFALKTRSMKRAYYQKPISEFLIERHEVIFGELARNHPFFSLELPQQDAWTEQISNLKEQLKGIRSGEIFFEFSIPRMGKRADVVLLINGIVFVLEYKVGAKKFERYAIDQAVDYTLDLKNFHAGSHHRYVIPILISTRATEVENRIIWCRDDVCAALLSNGQNLGSLITMAISAVTAERNSLGNQASSKSLRDTSQEPFDSDEWAESDYKPTPTIIEAAQALYQGHAVEEISRSDAGARNLTLTTKAINKIIEHSRTNGRKSICFVTGVPGAGKTLAGLNISTQKFDQATEEHAVFLSGNGPLVAVLKEALARDEVQRSRLEGREVSKKEALRAVSEFIQNIHHFRDNGLISSAPPPEHVVVFDEAQRAWTQIEAERFMIRKRKAKSFDMSEPAYLISVMNRRSDWCTVICLIGGGQEINRGEAGLVEWFKALQTHFRDWDVYHSGQLSNKSYNWGEDLEAHLNGLNVIKNDALHLNVSIRSFREAEKLSEFVSAVVDGNCAQAKSISQQLQKYPLMLTRDLNQARSWLRQRAFGSERLGLIASSGAIRLKPEGVTVRAKIDPVTWFLNGKEDIRSSYYLEDVATEFDIQGLELDYAGICWDADMRWERDAWRLYNFKGTKWQTIKDKFRRVYLPNAYRVLLTRARQGIVVFVPKGSEDDPTRPPKFYDGTYEFLKNCGFHELP